VGHSSFGANFQSGSGKPAWTHLPFNQWSDTAIGLEAQVAAAYTLMAGFTLKGIAPRKLRVHVGASSSTSLYHLSFDAHYTFGFGLQSAIAIDWPRKQIFHASGALCNLAKGSFGEDQGRPFFDFEIDFPAGQHPSPANQSARVSCTDCSCEVLLEMESGKGPFIPLSGKFVQYTMFSGDESNFNPFTGETPGVNHSEVSSISVA
jgi:hypothetical protein